MATSVSAYFGNIKNTVQSFWHGMSITLSYMLRRPITVQYPDRTELPVKDTLPPRYRGFLEVDVSICTGCQACERACPIACIRMVLEKDPANPKQRQVTQFDIDEAKCMYCGLCVEPCPTGSIQHTREFEASQRSVRNLTFRWADPAFPVYKVAKDAAYFPRAPLGSLVRALVEARRWDAPGPEFLPPEPARPAAAAEPRPAKPAPAAKVAPPAPSVAPGPSTPGPESPVSPSPSTSSGQAESRSAGPYAREDRDSASAPSPAPAAAPESPNPATESPAKAGDDKTHEPAAGGSMEPPAGGKAHG